jgi:hypothetical protein
MLVSDPSSIDVRAKITGRAAKRIVWFASYLLELVSQAIAELPLTLSNEQTIKYARRTNGIIQHPLRATVSSKKACLWSFSVKT